MHPFFAPLEPWEVALLVVILSVGGSDQIRLLAYTPAEIRQRLEAKAQALLEIASDKRVPLMVHELKNLLEDEPRRGLERLDPSWIVFGLRGESPRVVGLVLLDLPPAVVRSVLKRLPAGIRQGLPPKQELQQVGAPVSAAVRRIFASRFHPMPAPTQAAMDFQGVIHLSRIDLFRLVRDLGSIELGQAFVSVGKMALADLCRRLTRQQAHELVEAVRRASQVDVPDPKSAQRFLSRVVENFRTMEEFLQKSGVWRLAKACLLSPKGWAEVLAQRLPRPAGKLLVAYMEKARDMEDLTPAVLARLQDSILVRIVELSMHGTLDAIWAQTPMGFHDPESAQRAISLLQIKPEAEVSQKIHLLDAKAPVLEDAPDKNG